MWRARGTVALTLCLMGCGAIPRGEPVELLTGARDQCFLSWTDGRLVVDAEYGTALADGDRAGTPVMWWPGFTGRRVGSEVEVLDPEGNVVAITGKRYRIHGGSWYELPHPWAACGPDGVSELPERGLGTD